MSHIFLTRIDPETFGGLPGSLITINDSGGFSPEGVHLFGPPPLQRCLESMAAFVNVPNMKVRVYELQQGGAGAEKPKPKPMPMPMPMPMPQH